MVHVTWTDYIESTCFILCHHVEQNINHISRFNTLHIYHTIMPYAEKYRHQDEENLSYSTLSILHIMTKIQLAIMFIIK